MLITGQAAVTDEAADFNSGTPTPSAAYNSLAIKNTGGSTVYVGRADDDDFTLDDTTGWPVDPGESFSADYVGVDDVFVVCAAGESSTIAFVYGRNA